MTHKSNRYLIVFLLVSGILFSACSPGRTPADVIVDYLNALAEHDQASAVSNSCAAWEEKAIAETASYANVEVTLENLDCQVLSQVDTEATVSCTGSFISSYTAGEDQELDLSGLVFSLQLTDGEWRMCGYDW